MRVIDKVGGTPTVKLDKNEVRRLLEASYLLRRMGLMLEHDTLVELAAGIKLQVATLAPEWTADEQTGALTRTASGGSVAAETPAIAERPEAAERPEPGAALTAAEWERAAAGQPGRKGY